MAEARDSTKGTILGLSDFIGRKESIMGTQSIFGSRFSWRSKSIASKGPVFSPGTPKSQVQFSPNGHLGRNGSLTIRKSVDLSLRIGFTILDKPFRDSTTSLHHIIYKCIGKLLSKNFKIKNSSKERSILRVLRSL